MTASERLAYILAGHKSLADSNDDVDVRMPSLMMRKPSQKMMLSQIFGEPESQEEEDLLKMLRIRR